MKNTVFMFLAGLFLVTYPMSAILSAIHVEYHLFGIPFVTQYGALVLLLGKGCLDIVQEFWGKRTRRSIVLTGFFLRVFVFIAISIGLSVGTFDKAAEEILKNSLRVMIAGEITIMLMEYWLDSNVYQWLLEKFNRKKPAVRSIISNLSTLMVNSPILAYIGFWGTKPNRVVHLMAWTKPYAELPMLIFVAVFTGTLIKVLRAKGWWER